MAHFPRKIDKSNMKPRQNQHLSEFLTNYRYHQQAPLFMWDPLFKSFNSPPEYSVYDKLDILSGMESLFVRFEELDERFGELGVQLVDLRCRGRRRLVHVYGPADHHRHGPPPRDQPERVLEQPPPDRDHRRDANHLPKGLLDFVHPRAARVVHLVVQIGFPERKHRN